jgi:hypothetical protein
VVARRPGVGRRRGTVRGGERQWRFPVYSAGAVAEKTGVDSVQRGNIESGDEETAGRGL